MKLRKLIPGVVAALLALVLSVGLLIHVVPGAAADTLEIQLLDWVRVASGNVRGADHSMYHYSCVLIVRPNEPVMGSEPGAEVQFVNSITSFMDIVNQSLDEFPGVPGAYTSLEVYMYIPELDIYVTESGTGGKLAGENAGGYSASCILPACTEVDGVLYPGELIRATAKYYLMGREVATVSWCADS